MSRSSAPRAPTGAVRSELRKLIPAGAVFCAVIGGYVAFAYGPDALREARAPLPAADAPSGGCTLWFIGSSTIYRWSSLDRDMRPWDAHRRGINGAMLPQIVHRLKNEPAGHAPAAMVVYAGENDIAAGASADDAFAKFRRFLAVKTMRYGALPVIAVSLKPSPARWANLPAQTAFNDALMREAAVRGDLHVVDVRAAMLRGGRPGPFYVSDGIHMNTAGYALWTRTLRAALPQLVPALDRCRAAA